MNLRFNNFPCFVNDCKITRLQDYKINDEINTLHTAIDFGPTHYDEII